MQLLGATMEFDVSRYELADSAVLTLQNLERTDDLTGADGKNPVKITVYSPGSTQGVRALHKAGQAAQLRLQGLVRGKVEKNAAIAADAERVIKLVEITANIDNFPVEGGATAIYSNPKLGDIADQVESFFSDKANFSKASSNNSSST